jgi:hypothetical protein
VQSGLLLVTLRYSHTLSIVTGNPRMGPHKTRISQYGHSDNTGTVRRRPGPKVDYSTNPSPKP